jgi:flagellar motor switch protein FliG
MARGIDLYKKVQAMDVKHPAPSAEGESPDPPLSRGDRFLREIEEKQGLLKKAGTSPEGGDKLDRIAKFLVILGKEQSGKILQNLSESEVEQICSRIALIKRVDALESQSILEEFGFIKTVRPDRSTGGVAAARDILSSAFGEEKAREILERAVPESRPVPFAFLGEVELPQLLNLVKEESPFVLSVLLSSLPPEKSSRILKSLDNETRKTVLLRMGRMEKIDKNALALMEQTLMERLNKQGRMETLELDGPNRLASILKYMPLSDEKKILDDLESDDPGLSADVKEQLLTIDSVLHMRGEDLQLVLQDYSEKSLARLLRGKDEEIRDRLLASLSSRRRQFVEEESLLLGPIRRSEAEEATREFLEDLRKREERGDLVIMREEEEYI